MSAGDGFVHSGRGEQDARLCFLGGYVPQRKCYIIGVMSTPQSIKDLPGAEIEANPDQLIREMKAGNTISTVIGGRNYTVAPTSAVMSGGVKLVHFGEFRPISGRVDLEQLLAPLPSGFVSVEHLRQVIARSLEEAEAEEMVSIRDKNKTGVDNTVWVSPRGFARHAARIKIAVDPAHTIDPTTPGAKIASMALHDYSTVGADLPAKIKSQAKKFIERNRKTIQDHWDYKIDGNELLARLKPPETKKRTRRAPGRGSSPHATLHRR